MSQRVSGMRTGHLWTAHPCFVCFRTTPREGTGDSRKASKHPTNAQWNEVRTSKLACLVVGQRALEVFLGPQCECPETRLNLANEWMNPSEINPTKACRVANEWMNPSEINPIKTCRVSYTQTNIEVTRDPIMIPLDRACPLQLLKKGSDI